MLHPLDHHNGQDQRREGGDYPEKKRPLLVHETRDEADEHRETEDDRVGPFEEVRREKHERRDQQQSRCEKAEKETFPGFWRILMNARNLLSGLRPLKELVAGPEGGKKRFSGKWGIKK